MPDMKTYSVTVIRWDGDNQEELVDAYITADQAIDLMLQIQAMPEETEEEEIEEVEEEIPTEEPKQVVKKAEKKNMGRQANYDKEAVKVDIQNGIRPSDIANTHGVPVGTVYQLKSQMKKDGELLEVTEQKEDVVDNHPKSRVKRMVKSGDTDTEIYNAMHDFMTDIELREAIEEARA